MHRKVLIAINLHGSELGNSLGNSTQEFIDRLAQCVEVKLAIIWYVFMLILYSNKLVVLILFLVFIKYLCGRVMNKQCYITEYILNKKFTLGATRFLNESQASSSHKPRLLTYILEILQKSKQS